MYPKLFRLLVLLVVPASLFAQENDRIPAEAVAGRLTKSLKGELNLPDDPLSQIRQINLHYALAVAEWRQNAVDDDPQRLDRLSAEWEQAIRSALPAEALPDFLRRKTDRLNELRLAGLHRWTVDLTLALGLSNQQIAQVEHIYRQYAPQQNELLQGGDPPAVKDRRLRGLEQERKEALRGVLTDAQFANYQRRQAEGWGEQ